MANPPIRLVKHTQCKLSLWYYKLLTFNMKKYNEEYNLKMFYGCIRATLRNYYIFFSLCCPNICTVLDAIVAWKNTVEWGFQREK